MRLFNWLVFSLSLLVLSSVSGASMVLAQEELPLTGRDTGLELPRFASIKSDEVFVRVGPGQRYPIEYVYQRAGLPVKITKEFEGWRKVEDYRGNEGWVHNVLVSGRKMALVIEDNVPLRRKPRESGFKVADLSKDVIVEIDECADGYCKVETQGFKGFAPQSVLWGMNESN